ncbi:MAG: glucosaminidase domain-containing protein [Bacteroidales bacterium]|nr:glucosaminidase domain-containing protein [Bacteroidales bacterium]
MKYNCLFKYRKLISIIIIILLCNGSVSLSGSLFKNDIINFEERPILTSFLLKNSGFGKQYVLNPALFKSAKLFKKSITDKYFIKAISKPSFEIMNLGNSTSDDLMRFLIKYNSSLDLTTVLNIANLYIEESKKEGINHDIAFCQMCLETGFLKFGGIVNIQQNNFCGLGATGISEKGEVFSSKRLGVRAHIQHLKAYASLEKLNNHIVDNRFRFVKRGIAPTIDKLTGNWALDPKYDVKIRFLLNRLYKNMI